MKWIIPFISLVLLTCNTFAQTPEKVSYQAVIRNNNNELVTNSKVNLRIILRQDSPDGYIAYQENHQAMTNVNGLVSLQIGEGNKEVGEFSGIDWSQGTYFIETQLDVKNTQDFSVTGISEILSVPYALHAKSADSFTGDGNELAFDKWDKDITDDFSGSFNDLSEVPDLYTKNQVDSLVVNLQGGDGVVKSLSLEGVKLSISGGNSISFEYWDTDARDDFSGNYSDLRNIPSIYTRNQVDSLVVNLDGGDGKVQSLVLEGEKLSISGGNSISFNNWDTDTSDDFSGDYSDLKNTPSFFSGKFTDLTGVPNLYTKNQVDSLVVNLDGGDGIVQSLNLEGEKLSISGGNSISFDNWDTDATDDFDGAYSNLTGTPDVYTKAELYTKTEVNNLVSGIEVGGGSTPQNLSLDANELSISGGNTLSFDNWDTDASNDFDGEYSSLKNAPKMYTQAEVDSIKAEILKTAEETYSKKAKIISLNSSRNIMSSDIGNTIACKAEATLTITSGFSAMKDGEVINLEVHATVLTVKGASGVTINGSSGGSLNKGNNQVYTGGIVRKISNNLYIVL